MDRLLEGHKRFLKEVFPVRRDQYKLLADRQKVDTPRPALPESVSEVVKKLTGAFSWSGPIGITFPGVVTDGVTRTAANMDPAWIGLGDD